MYGLVLYVLKPMSLLMGNGSHVYKESDLSQEELYLKKEQLASFFKELRYVGGIFSRDKAPKKRLKRLI